MQYFQRRCNISHTVAIFPVAIFPTPLYRGVGIIRTGIIRTALELSGQLFALTQYWNYRKVLGKKKIVLPGVLEKANQEIAAALLGYEEHEIAKKSKK